MPENAQISGDDAPANPALEAREGEAMRQAATEIMSALVNTYATFDTGMPVTSLHEPGFAFMLQTSFRTMATLLQDDSRYTQVVSQLFIRFGVETAIATGLLRRLVESLRCAFKLGFHCSSLLALPSRTR